MAVKKQEVHKMKECAKCIHNAVCETAKACDGYVSGCKHFKEKKQGRWVSNGMCNHKPSRFRNPDKWTVWKCSECGYSNGRKFNANYCPNCGAKMDGGNEDG